MRQVSENSTVLTNQTIDYKICDCPALTIPSKDYLKMSEGDKKIVTVGSRLSKFIGSKATREKKMQAAAMQAEFTLRDTLIILCYLSKEADREIANQARKNLIPAARSWYSRPDRPELPEPIHDIVLKVIEKVGLGERETAIAADDETVRGNIGLLGLGEIIQAVDHNNRTVAIKLTKAGESAQVYTENGKVVGAVAGADDGLDALYRAFSWLDASFQYLHSPPGVFQNRIKANTLNLVMDALEHSSDDDPFDMEDSKTWQVLGHLKVMNIFEIAEIFEMNSKQTVCRLTREDADGLLYFRSGRIVNASLGAMTGMDAACHLLAWPNANFSIARGGEEVSEAIHVGMQNLIIEAMRLLDEGVTVTDRIAEELAMINELFEARDLVSLPVLEKVRLVFSDDQRARETLETDANPLVRKAIKVKISKTVHKYLSSATDYQVRLMAARGNVPLSTTEKLVLLSYLSHDESQEIREIAKSTLAAIDLPTYKKGFGADLHPSVMDFLVRETLKDESLISIVAGCPTLLEETALYLLDNWKTEGFYEALLENRKLLERSPAVVVKLAACVGEDSTLKNRIDAFEESMIRGQAETKVEGPLSFFGISGLAHAARQGMRSGTILVETPTATGSVFFQRGRVVGAQSGDLEGIPALEEIVKARGARFRYLLRTYHHKQNLDPTAAEELLEKPGAGPYVEEEEKALRLVTGSLAAMDIYELLHALEGSPIPVRVSVVCEEGTGDIFRDRSRILHAQVEGKDGPMNAMAAIMSWTGLRFILRHEQDEFPVTVDKSLGDFFSEATKLIPDEMIRTTKPGELPEWELSETEFESLYHQILNMGVAEKLKLAFFGSKGARDILVRDANKMVCVAVVKSPKIQESEIETISKSRQVGEDVLRQIAATKEFMKSYSIKLNLASNSKTPLPIAMKLLPQLRELDLKKLARSKNISAQVAIQARRLAEAKGGTH
jgi:hypothetical protein